jgi:hypothetical protein
MIKTKETMTEEQKSVFDLRSYLVIENDLSAEEYCRIMNN